MFLFCATFLATCFRALLLLRRADSLFPFLVFDALGPKPETLYPNPYIPQPDHRHGVDVGLPAELRLVYVYWPLRLLYKPE